MLESESCAIPLLHYICTVQLITAWCKCCAKSSRRSTQAVPNNMPCCTHFAQESRGATPVTVTVHESWIARQGRTNPPCLFRHAATMLNIITLSSRNMSRRSCNSNSRSRSLAMVVFACLGAEHVEQKRHRRLCTSGWAGGRADWSNKANCVHPSPAQANPCHAHDRNCVCHAVASLVSTPTLATLTGSGRLRINPLS